MNNYLFNKVKHKNKSCQYCMHSNSCFAKDFNNIELSDISKCIKDYYILQAGERLRSNNEKFRYLYVIKSGSAKDTVISSSGSEHVADFYLPSDIIGLDAISTGKHVFNTIALETSVICVLSFDELLTLAKRIPKLHFRILNLTSQKLFNRTQTLINNHHTAKQRIAFFINDLINRYRHRGLLLTKYCLSMSRYDIGSYLNLTSETVSRTFTKLQTEGILIANKKYIQLINPAKLSQLLSL